MLDPGLFDSKISVDLKYFLSIQALIVVVHSCSLLKGVLDQFTDQIGEALPLALLRGGSPHEGGVSWALCLLGARLILGQ